MKWGSSVLQPPMLRSRHDWPSAPSRSQPRCSISTRVALPAGDEPDLDLGRIGAVAAQVPEVDEPMRRLPGHHLAPVVLRPGGRALEDPPADAPFKHHLQVRLADGGVVGRPPGGDPLGPHHERVLRRAGDLEGEPQGLDHSAAASATVFSATSRKRVAASPQTCSR